LFGLGVIALLLLSSCAKQVNGNDSLSAQDANNVSGILNAAMDDASNSMSGSINLSGKTDGLYESICGADVTLDTAKGAVNITYTGNNCNAKISRTGSLTITLLNHAHGVRWNMPGAVLEITFNNLQFTINKNSQSYTINGTHYLINESGGRAWAVMDGLESGTVTHKQISSNFNVTFADGTTSMWNVNRTRTYTNAGGVKSQTLNSDTPVNGYYNVGLWGTNRNGEAFEASFISPIVSTSTCGFADPVSGEYNHHVAKRSVDVLYGVDSDGNPEVPGQCPYGYKITYASGRKTLTQINPYF
jgi:hypothetical protein